MLMAFLLLDLALDGLYLGTAIYFIFSYCKVLANPFQKQLYSKKIILLLLSCQALLNFPFKASATMAGTMEETSPR